MSYLWKASLCAVVLVATGILAATSPFAQDSQEKDGLIAPNKHLLDKGLYSGMGYVDPNVRPGAGDWNEQVRYGNEMAQRDYAAKVAAFRRAQGGAERETKKEELKKKLTEIFDADMKARKAQAEEIEARLKAFQEKYKAREAAKDSIIDLQIQVLENDAEGLGFPKRSEATPRVESSRNRLSPFVRGSVVEIPSQLKGAETREVSLDELLKTKPSLVESLKKKNHFVVSQDGKMYAYVGQSHPQAPSIVQVRDSEVGRVLATYQARGVIAEIRFQEGGVGVRLPDGKFELPIPLGAPENVSRNAEPGSPDGKMSELYRPLEELKKAEPALVKKLTEEFVFVESADGKLYAYANVNYPNGPSHVQLIESATGKLLGKYTAQDIVTCINLRGDGVLVCERNGPLFLKIPFKNGAEALSPNSATSNLPVAASGYKGTLDEYTELRRVYLKAHDLRSRWDGIWKQRLVDEQKNNPEMSKDSILDKFKPEMNNNADVIKKEIEQADKLLDAKLKLLDLDVQFDKATLNIADSEFSKAESVNRSRPGAINDTELHRLRHSMEKAKIQLERSVTIFDLFASIKKEPTATPK